MQYHLKATAEMIEPIQRHIRSMTADTIRAGRSLLIALDELVPGVLYGTISWVLSMIVEEAEAARLRGCDNFADKLYHTADLLCNCLRDLSGNLQEF